MASAVIPRRVHRIWLGPYRMPAEYTANARAWERFGWVVHDWTAQDLEFVDISDATRGVLDDIEAKGANAGGGIDKVGKWVQMADVWSYELVREFGGVYANTDIEPLRDLGPALDGLDAFVVAEDPQFLSNALMGATAGHPFFVDISARLPGRFAEYRWREMNAVTGPHLLTAAWKDGGCAVKRLEPVPFFPVGFDTERDRSPDYRPHEGFYVDHHWGHKHPELLEEAS